MISEIVFISDVNISDLVLTGFYKGVLYSVTTGFISLGISYCLKLLGGS